MYVPKQFRIEDEQHILSFVRANSFATLISTIDGVPYATHVPLLVEKEVNGWRIEGHVAKANRHAQFLTAAPALAIFTGPHAFISHAWYEEPNTVSTWNYTAVHFVGEITLIENKEAFRRLLERTESVYHGKPYDQLPSPDDAVIDNMMRGIVGFTMHVTSVEANFKLSQHHPTPRKQKVIAALQKSTSEQDQQIARLMQQAMADKER